MIEITTVFIVSKKKRRYYPTRKAQAPNAAAAEAAEEENAAAAPSEEEAADEACEASAEDLAEEPAEAPEGPAEEAAEEPQAEGEPAEQEAAAEAPAEQEQEPAAQPAADAELAKAQAAAEDFKKKWYSVSAEYENYRKRTALTRSQAYAEGRRDVVSKLFPVADSLDRAFAACADEQTKKGIGMVLKNFEKLLEGEHITVIAPVGEPFDANRCEAILAVDPKEGEESGIVREVYAKGYEQDGKVLRFAQVVVTK